MKLTPRAKLLLLMGIFALPIVASVLAYNFSRPRPTANYGELLTPPLAWPAQALQDVDGVPFRGEAIAGKWALIVADAAPCEAACRDKLGAIRQLRLAMGRNASRVERVFVIEGAAPDAELPRAFPGMQVAIGPRGIATRPGMLHDRTHIYLMDPNGNVMMRWPWPGDPHRMIRDLERLLKASQIG